MSYIAQCAICWDEIDKTRQGDLCSPCYYGLDCFNFDPVLLRKAAQYVRNKDGKDKG